MSLVQAAKRQTATSSLSVLRTESGWQFCLLLAGQVFEHMTEHPTPTRSELCAAFDALQSGYAGFVLSDETAIGCDPVASCRVAALFQ